MSLVPYTTEAAITVRLSADGVTLHTDDLWNNEISEIILDASADIDTYCLAHYSQANLNTSEIVERWATYLSCYYLTTRRGNPAPAPYKFWYEKLLNHDTGMLMEVYRGQLPIADIPKTFLGAPRMSNVKMAMFPTPHPRVQRKRSSTQKPTAYQQRVDRTDPLQYVPDYMI